MTHTGIDFNIGIATSIKNAGISNNPTFLPLGFSIVFIIKIQ